MQTFLEWHRTTEAQPDDDILVLCSNDTDTYAGFMDGDAWRYADAIPAPAPQWWAHFPQGPA
jgi:hypothetical protein